MKLTPGRWSAFLRGPDPAIGAVLVFGPDRGLVRERGEALVRCIVGVDADPLQCSDLTTAQLRAAPPLLSDQALTFSLLGGRQVLRVRDASDGMIEAVRILLSNGRWPSFVLLEAGDLGKRSTLREVIEGASNAAAIACYEDDPATLRQVIAETLRLSGLTATPEVLDFLALHLGNDRAITRSELEKLSLYMGTDAVGAPRQVSLEDVTSIVGDARAAAWSGVIAAVVSGDRAMAVRALADAGGLEPIGLLRMLAGHLQRLYAVVGDVASGRPLKDAIASLRPPVFFREVESFGRQARLWTPVAIETALLAILQAEAACKQTGAPQRLLAEQACLTVGGIAARLQRR